MTDINPLGTVLFAALSGLHGAALLHKSYILSWIKEAKLWLELGGGVRYNS